MLLISRVFLITSLALIVLCLQPAPSAARGPVPEASVETLYERLQRFEGELERRLTQAVERAAEGAVEPLTPGDTAGFIDQLRFLEEEIRRAGSPIEEQLMPKLARVENRLSDLRRIDAGQMTPQAAPGTASRQTVRGAVGQIRLGRAGTPANDDCADAIEMGFGSFSGSTELATQDGEASCGSSIFTPDVWFKYVAPVSGTVFVDTLGSGYDTVLSVHSTCPGTAANELTCNDDVFGSASAVDFAAGVATEHWIRVSGFGGETGAFLLNVGMGGALSGTVVRASSSDPLPGITVDLWNHQGAFVGAQLTDGDGLYAFGNLAPGGYFATTRNSQGFLNEIYDELPCPGGGFSSSCDPTSGTQILVENEATVAGIDFALDLGGSIRGTVSEVASGSGLEDIRVEIWDATGEQVDTRFSDQDGVYEATGLAPGTYFVSTDTSDFFNELYDDLPCAAGAPFGCDPTTGTPIAVEVETVTVGIDFDLDRLAGISGTVTEAITGDPLSSIRVEIYDSVGNFAALTNTTSDGTYVVSGLVAGTYFAAAESFFDHFDELYDDLPCAGGPPSGCDPTTGAPIEVKLGGTTSGIDFVLDRLGSITGTVTAEGSGEPLPSIRLELYRPTGSFVDSALTDAFGMYTFDRLSLSSYFMITDDDEVINELYDGLPCEPSCDVTAGTPVAAAPNVVTTGIDFAVAEKGSISGRLTDEASGDPLSFRRLEIWSDSGTLVDSTFTDSSGDYSATGLDAGTYFVSTDLSSGVFLDEAYDDLPCFGGAFDGCDPTTATPVAVVLGATTPGIDFALGSGGEITGTLTAAATDDPLAGITVRVFDASGERVRSVTSDASGVYRALGLAAGTYFVRTDDREYRDELYDDLPCVPDCDPTTGTGVTVTLGAETTDIDFVLDPSGVITGTVLEAATGLPVSTRVEVYDASGVLVDSDFTDGAGAYELDGLDAGAYFVRTRVFSNSPFIDEVYDDLLCQNGCVPTTGTPIEVEISEIVSGIDFELSRSGAISGVVTAVGGGLLAGIRVEVWDASGQFVRSDNTDTAGIYTVDGLEAGTYFVLTNSTLVLDELYDGLVCEAGCDPTAGTAVPVALDNTTRHIDFELDLPGSITGVVTRAAGGAPISGLRVELWSASGVFLQSASTDLSGVYLFSGLAPGIYFAATDNFQDFFDELYEGLPCPGGPPAGCDPTTGTPIPVAVNSTTSGIDFELQLLGGISGRVTNAATGAPLASVRVLIWDAESDFVKSDFTDATGSYSVAELLPGTYFVSTDAPGLIDYLDELYDNLPCFGGVPLGCEPDKGAPVVVANDVTVADIDFDLLPTATGVTGTVTAAATGEPQANVIVDVWSAAGQRVASVATSAAGTYFVDLPPATYFVSTDNGVGLVDLVYDGRLCPGSAFAGACDPTLGTAVVIDDSGAVGDPSIAAGIDFALLSPSLYVDGFESGNTSLWSLTFGSP